MRRYVLLIGLLAGCAAGEVPGEPGAPCPPGQPGCEPRLPGGDAGPPSPDRGVGDAAATGGADAGGADGAATDATAPDAAPDPGAVDFDRDGVPAADDCDDADGRRWPGAPETPDDGIDSDCDGFDAVTCGRHEDCPPGHYCAFGDAGGRCLPGCRSGDCREGLRCHTLLRACVPDDQQFTCGRSAGCPEGSVCRVEAVPGTDLMNAHCRPPVGPQAGAGPCDRGADCASGVCLLGGHCLDLCLDDDDCGGANRCLWTRLFNGNTAWRLRTCAPPPRPCGRLGDCAADERCVPVASADAPRGFALACVPGRAGIGAGGAPCARGEDCISGTCLEDGLCFGPCGADGDCVGDTRCYEAGVSIVDDGSTALRADDLTVGLPACLPGMGSGAPCTAAADCQAGEFCGLGRSTDGRRFVPRCWRAGQGAPAGAACAAGEACASGTCRAGACLGVCGDDDDCAEGARCVAGRYVVDTQGTQDPHDDDFADVSLCVR